LAAHSVVGSLARSQFVLQSLARRDIARRALLNQRDGFWSGAPAYSSDITNSLMATEARRQAMSLTVASSFKQPNEDISLAKPGSHRKLEV
jgi:hypothetical protein